VRFGKEKPRKIILGYVAVTSHFHRSSLLLGQVVDVWIDAWAEAARAAMVLESKMDHHHQFVRLGAPTFDVSP
jgi:hypothetical protein